MEDDRSATPLRGCNANVEALLGEISALLKRLLDEDEPGSIDLRSIPLGGDDYELLRETLGEGEIRAEVENFGITRIYQTGIAGVWWVTHYNDEEDIIGDFIEVAFCPERLIADLEAVREGLSALRARLVEQQYLTRRPPRG